MRHGTCFRRRLSAHHAGAAPHSAVAELGVVRRLLHAKAETANIESSHMEIIHLTRDIFAILAIAFPAIWGIWVWLKTRRGDISWHALQKAVEKLHVAMANAKYRPNYIVCIGRAGGMVGAMLSHRFKQPVIPVIVLTFTYELTSRGTAHDRKERLLACSTIADSVQNVLLLGVDVMTGETMKSGEEELKKHNIQEYKTACLYLNPISRRTPDYFVEKRTKRLQYPRMPNSFSETYEHSALPVAESTK